MTTAIAISNSINSVINNLADKLHVPAAKLFECLVGQAHVASYQYMLWAVGISLVWLILISLSIYGSIRSFRDKEEGAGWVFIVVTVILFLMLVIIDSSFISAYLTASQNPDYWALNHLVSMLAPGSFR